MSEDKKEDDVYELLEKSLNRIWAMHRALEIVAIISSYANRKDANWHVTLDLLSIVHTEVNKALEDDNKAREEL